MTPGVSHWLELAERGNERAFSRAKAAATTANDWLGILRSLRRARSAPVDEVELAEIASRLLDASVAEGSAAGFAEAARIRVEVFGDRDGARAALERGMAALRVRAPSAPAWQGLASAFAELLSNEAAMRACVGLGCEQARRMRDAGGLSVMARTLLDCDDRAGAAALLREAEALLGPDGRVGWSVSDTWDDLGDPEAATRVRLHAIAIATDTSAALHVAELLSPEETAKLIGPALDRARAVAKTAIDWLDIAERAANRELDASLVRDALDRAAAASQGDDVARRHVASGYATWLQDPVAAEAVGPRGFLPEMLRVPRLGASTFLSAAVGSAAAAGSASALFEWLRARVTDSMLSAIAHADYDQESDEHYAALAEIHRTGCLAFGSRSATHALPWHPHEVCALTRWSRSADIEQAFCSTLLWLAPGNEDPLDVAGAIVESCVALGGEAIERAAELFAWHLCTRERDLSGDPEPVLREPTEHDESDAVARFALLLLRAAADPTASDPRVPALARAVANHPSYPPRLFAVTPVQQDLWQSLVESILAPLAQRCEKIALVLQSFRRDDLP